MGFLRILIGIGWQVIVALLLVQFIAGIAFSPSGLPENLAILQVPLTLLGVAAASLSYPVDFVLGLILNYVPQGVLQWFPVSPAGVLVDTIINVSINGADSFLPKFSQSDLAKHLQSIHYGELLPGVFNWALLITMSFWSYAEQFLLKILNRFDRAIYNKKRATWRTKTLARYRDIDKTG